ncbi:MAG TPA: 50S ribosomal protein L29 [Candidatus Paceibacterota bacterium]|nr:50S ribosomal protein L29 [Candidatus Paceibacterota bacterium]
MKKKLDTATKNTGELQTEVATLRAKFRGLAFKAAGAQATSASERRQIKRDIARLLTALRAQVVDKA